MESSFSNDVLVTRLWAERDCVSPIASLQGTGLPAASFNGGAGYGMGSGTALAVAPTHAAAPKHTAPTLAVTAVRQDADRARPRGSTL